MMDVKIFFLLSIFSFTVSAQSVEVKKETSRIEGRNVSGYQVSLSAPEEEVRASFSRYLKTMGRIKYSGDYITLAEPVIGGTKYPNTLYATTKQIGSTTAAWVAIPSDTGEEKTDAGRDLEKLVHDFGVTFHREKIQLQIDESVQALQAVEKQQLRFVNQNRDINNKIESNKRQKIQLEKSLVENKVELEDLTKRLEANVKAQDSVAIAGDQIRKVVEKHRANQQKIH